MHIKIHKYSDSYQTFLNRLKIYIALDNKGNVSLLNIPDMMFGGEFLAPNGTVVQLDNAFAMAFTAQHLKSAREKCGYCPCTRRSLHDPKVRREMGDEDIDSNSSIPANNVELDELIRKLSLDILRENPNDCANGVNAYDRILKDIESMNHNAVATLTNAGYNKATLCKTTIKENDDDLFQSSRENVTTRPNTRERQELLASSKNKAGPFFRITRGGSELNCSDMLIAIEMNRMKDKAKKLQKMKADCLSRAALLEAVDEIMDECGGPRRLHHYKKCIEWKTKKKPGQKNLAKLKAEWEKKYAKLDAPPEIVWTKKEEARLQRLERGHITSISDNSLFKHARATKCSFLGKQLKLVDLKSQTQLMADAYQSFPEEFRLEMKAMMETIDAGEEFKATCVEYDSADEDLDSDSESIDDNNSFDDIARPAVESDVVSDNDDADDVEISNAENAEIFNADDAEIANADDAEISNADNDYDSEPSFDSKLLEDDDTSEDDDRENDSAQEEEDDDVDVSTNDNADADYADADAESANAGEDGELLAIFETDSLESDKDNAANASVNNREDENDQIEEEDGSDDSDDSIEQEQSAATVSYESLDKDELIKLCRSRGIKKVSRRWKESTLIAKLAESGQE